MKDATTVVRILEADRKKVEGLHQPGEDFNTTAHRVIEAGVHAIQEAQKALESDRLR